MNLARSGVNPSDPPTSTKTFRHRWQRFNDWRIGATWPSALCWQLGRCLVVVEDISCPTDNDLSIGELALPAFVGSLLAIGVAAWWWSSSAHTASSAHAAMMAPSAPAPLTQAAPEAVAPKDAAPTAVALSSDLAQQLQPMTRDLAAVSQAVEQLKVRQEQLIRDNENVASQLKASQEEMARNNGIIDQIKATQIQMARESQMLTERLNASQEQLARVIANASEPKVMPEEPKVNPKSQR